MKNTKKILIVMHELGLGGAERVMVNLVNQFVLNHEVHFCLLNGKGELIQSLDPKIKLHVYGFKHASAGFFRIMALIRKIHPEIVFSSITRVNMMLGLIKGIPGFKKYKIGARIVNNLTAQAKKSQSLKNRVLDSLFQRTINNLDFIVLQSHYMKEDLLKSYTVDLKKLYVIRNPLDTEVIERKLKLGISKTIFPRDKKNILSVGGLRPQKNYKFLISCFSYLPEEYHLYILGEGKERVTLEKLINGLRLDKRITLIGKDSNPYAYMAQADLCCLTSHYEGFPNVIIEENYCGKFVVAKKAPGVDEEIIENGINGYLVNEDDPKSFAEIIQRYSIQSFDENSIRRTTDKYKSEVISEYYNQIFSN